MNVRRTRNCLNLITIALALVGVVALMLAFVLSPPEPPEAQITVAPAAPSSLGPELPPREAFEPLLALDLRRPLYDAAPVVAAAAPKVIPPLRLKLVGTVVEPPAPGSDSGTPGSDAGNSYAIFTTGQGKTQFLCVGETAEEATVLAITETSVTIRYYDQEQSLTLAPPKEASQEGVTGK